MPLTLPPTSTPSESSVIALPKPHSGELKSKFVFLDNRQFRSRDNRVLRVNSLTVITATHMCSISVILLLCGNRKMLAQQNDTYLLQSGEMKYFV